MGFPSSFLFHIAGIGILDFIKHFQYYICYHFFQQIKGSLLTPVEASLSVWSVLQVGMKITGFILKGMEKNVNYGF